MDEGAFLCNRAAIRASDVEAKHHGSDVVGVDDHRATLEALDVDIARGRHGSAQRADVVHLAISAVAGPEQDLLQRADRADIGAGPARQGLVTGLRHRR